MATVDQPTYESVEAYHADTARISNAMLKCFMQSRREFEGYYVTGKRQRPESTAAQGVGSLTHADLLGEGDVSRFIQSPFENFRTKAAREWRDERISEGKQIVTEQELCDVMACYDAVRARIGRWLDMPGGESEAIETWGHAASGLRCRCMIDFRIVLPKRVVVLDLKTAADSSPDGFRHACERFHYPMQQVHYSAGIEANHSLPVEWYFVAVQNCWPYTCRLYQLDNETLSKAKAARERTLGEIAECYESGDWSEPGEAEVTPLECRNYYLSEFSNGQRN